MMVLVSAWLNLNRTVGCLFCQLIFQPSAVTEKVFSCLVSFTSMEGSLQLPDQVEGAVSRKLRCETAPFSSFFSALWELGAASAQP